ncbi:uncharacterized protein LOC125768313 [Anopheles funestus]|uniref:uncharacterized protein LOC125768313 n=1 Tax=Anopheles funestus TaxID=62324 RepID=UPI0020C5E2DF|nr:uncharacterized protein LOC125768313 [Anopheles funestus]
MCRKKWSSLCAYYRKEKAKINQSMITGSGRSDVYRSSWFAYESLGFIGNTVKPRKTQSTNKTSQKQTNEQSDTTNNEHDQPPYTPPPCLSTVDEVPQLSSTIEEQIQPSTMPCGTVQNEDLGLNDETVIVEPEQHPSTSSAVHTCETGRQKKKKIR